MLQLIFGRARCGKTETVFQRMEEILKKQGKAVLLVPEQLSFETERETVLRFREHSGLNLEVTSFTALAQSAAVSCGGAGRDLLSPADKISFMDKCLRELREELPLWRRQVAYPTFAAKVADMIGELKVSAVSADQLEEAAKALPEGSLREKCKSLALIYRAYDARIGNRFLDSADQLTRLARDLKTLPLFRGKSVFIDGFKGFTGQQYKIIEEILKQADSVTVTLFCNQAAEENWDIFYNSRKTAEHLNRLAARNRKPAATPIYLTQSYYQAEGMARLEKMMSGVTQQPGEALGCVTVCRAETAADEAKFAARIVRRLVREKQYRYRDFVIISNEPETYREPLMRQLELNGISCHRDLRIRLCETPLYRFVKAALGAANGWDTDAIFTALKIGLCAGFDPDEINRTENYTYLWNIRAGGWLKNWDMDPDGFAESKPEKQAEREKHLAQLNETRQRIVDVFSFLQRQMKGSVRDHCRAVFAFLEQNRTGEMLGRLFEEHTFRDENERDALRQCMDEMCHVLDSMVRCFGDDPTDLPAFAALLELYCQNTTIGSIPQTLDEVLFGDAEKICPHRPKVAILLGANLGVFPRLSVNTSLLADHERRTLMEEGIPIRDKQLFLTVEENLRLYTCVCSPENEVILCYHVASPENDNLAPAGFIEEILEKMGGVVTRQEPDTRLAEDNLPETEEALLQEAFFRFHNDLQGGASLNAVLEKYPRQAKIWKSACENFSRKNDTLSAPAAHALFGDTIPVSATKFDKFYSCHFQYFCKYGLNTHVLQPAQLDVLQRGTLVHYVLEQFCRRHQKDMATLGETAILAEVEEWTDAYLAGIQGSDSLMNDRFVFLIRKLKEGIADVLCRIVQEFSQSGFTVQECEVKIGRDGIIPTVIFPFEKGKNLALTGSIDRLDTWNSYVRIVDYKTGKKTFALSDTLFGMNLQMLLYLYAVIRGKGSPFYEKKPAGILYVPATRDENQPSHRASGLLCENETVIREMEKDNAGVFVPPLEYTKTGALSASRQPFFVREEAFGVIFDYIEQLAAKMGQALSSGEIAADPIDSSDSGSDACRYCDYRSVCGRDENRENRKVPKLKNEAVIEAMKEAMQDEV